ncbi:MAG TPA: hypothetical protein VMZ25_03740 [Terriglobales bacterium]|nr:hypothetical protein [Terriglobales bacterium]
MRFKILGLLALLIGAYFAVEGVLLAQKMASDTLRAQVYPLVAIFLALVLRVLQAEKHHRDRLKHAAPETAPSELREERAQTAIV